MSHLKIKQIAGPSNGKQGGIIVFDNTSPKWSSDLTSAIQLPAGTQAQRPVTPTDGLLRFNSDTDRIEAYEDGAWRHITTNHFADLEDGPGELQAGKAIRVNNDGSGLEYALFPTGLRKYRFRVNFTGTTPSSVQDLPEGWSIVVSGETLTVTHNLNTIPAFSSTFGASSIYAGEYVHRISGAGAAAAVSLRYNPNDLTKCTVFNVSTNSTGSASGTHAFIELYFLVV